MNQNAAFTNPYEPPDAAGLKAKPRSLVGMALVCLHISAALYVVAGLGLYALFSGDLAHSPELGSGAETFGAVIAVFCIALAVGVEVVAYGVHRRKFWAWIAGLVVFGLYLPSAFFPLGALGLWGLLATGSRNEFGVTRSDPRPPSESRRSHFSP